MRIRLSRCGAGTAGRVAWRWAAVGLPALLVLAPPVAPENAGREADRAGLRHRFDALNVALLDSTWKAPLSNDQGQLAWGVSLQLSALAEMLEATRDTLYASQFVRLADSVSAARDDRHQRVDEIRHRVLKGWGARKYSMNARTVWAVHTGLIAAPLARFAALVRQNGDWAERYGAAAARCLQTAREAMATHDSEYQPGPGPDEGRMLWFGECLPFNQLSVIGRAWLFIDAAADPPPYAERVTRLARFLRRHVRLQPDSSLVWGYWPALGELAADREDISHGALSADFITLCAASGIEFTDRDRRALERTLLAHVVQPDGRIAATVGGDGPASTPTAAILLWGRLARTSPAVRDTLLRLYRDERFRAASPQQELLGLAFLIASLSPSTE